MANQVGLPVEGLGTLVALVLPLLRVGEAVGLQAARREEKEVHTSLSHVTLFRNKKFGVFETLTFILH